MGQLLLLVPHAAAADGSGSNFGSGGSGAQHWSTPPPAPCSLPAARAKLREVRDALWVIPSIIAPSSTSHTARYAAAGDVLTFALHTRRFFRHTPYPELRSSTIAVRNVDVGRDRRVCSVADDVTDDVTDGAIV